MTDVDIANLALSHIGNRPIGSLSDASEQAKTCNTWFIPARDECLASHPWNFAMTRVRLTPPWVSLSGGTALANNGSGLIRVTSAAHGLSTGHKVRLSQSQGVTNANGEWFVTVINTNSFDLQNSKWAGAYTSGTGRWVRIPPFGWAYRYAMPSDFLAVRNVNGAEANEEDSIPFDLEGNFLLTDCDVVQLKYTARIENPALWDQTFINAFSFLLASYVATNLKGDRGKATELRQMYEGIIAPKAKTRDAQQTKGRTRDPDYNSDVIRARYGFKGF